MEKVTASTKTPFLFGDDGKSTTTAQFPFWHTTPARRPHYGYDLPLDISTYGVPLAFTVLVVLILCVVIAYTKAKRRHQRRLQGPRNNLRSISGGVPMNVAAYRNYGIHLAGENNSANPAPPYPSELPPSYEVAIQTPPSNSSSQTYLSNVSLVPAPPAYSEHLQGTNPAPGGPPGGPPTLLQQRQPAHHLTTPSTTTVTPIVGQPSSGGTHVGQQGDSDNKKDGEEPEIETRPTGPKPENASSSSSSQIVGQTSETPVGQTGTTQVGQSGSSQEGQSGTMQEDPDQVTVEIPQQ